MTQRNLLIHTKLSPPRPSRHTLLRERVLAQLESVRHYRLAIVQAGTGYGKSTALSAFAAETDQVAWYHLHPDDADPHVFLRHLAFSLKTAVPQISDVPLTLLEQWELAPGNDIWRDITQSLLNEIMGTTEEDVFLVLDDVHILPETAVSLHILNHLINQAPNNLHIILATRYPLSLPNLNHWRVRGEMCTLSQEDLAFTPEETADFFLKQYSITLNPDQIVFLADTAEGWPIALPLIGQRLQSGSNLEEALGQLSGTTGDLFTYLAQEVLAQHPEHIRQFLVETAVLHQMTAPLCNKLRQQSDSADILAYLLENDLFIVDLGDGHARYHHLFRELLLNQLDSAAIQALHLQAASLLKEENDVESAIYHFLAAKAFRETAVLLTAIGRRFIQGGQLDTMSTWIGSLPPNTLTEYPPLLSYLGDIARLRSRFEEALAWYQQAETYSRAQGNRPAIGQALRGQARVYLDTVNAVQAEAVLQEALRLSDGQDNRETQARLLDLLAENMLNQGHPDASEQYRAQARDLRQEGPGKEELSVRVMLRTGRLEEARILLEAQAAQEKQEPVLRPRAHRETLLLLSIILSMQGKQKQAYQCATDGIARGQALRSPFITAVGHMRQGHAWLLKKNETGSNEATRCFNEAIRISETLHVPRLRVEASWGLTQAYGFRGDLKMAQQIAEKGLELARDASDEWVSACISLTLGASFVLAGELETAVTWINQASSAFRECGDTYGDTVSYLWLCLIWHKQNDEPRLSRDLDDFLQRVNAHNYHFLFARKTLMGPPDPRSLVPILLFARKHEVQTAVADTLLNTISLSTIQHHPGYQLRVRLLGTFSLWRGPELVSASEWKRQKARQLFLFFLTNRQALWEREQITDQLWPELDPDAAERNFKIAYNALTKVLEPNRQRHAPSAYILRDGSRYGLRPEADIWLDVQDFNTRIGEGDALFAQNETKAVTCYQQALSLYRGEFLQEYPFEEWTSTERERLFIQYLRISERVAASLLTQEKWEEALQTAQTILNHDACWENAYRILMTAYVQMGNRAQAIRAYHRCVENLQSELGVPPTEATVQLWQQISGKQQQIEQARAKKS
jgi:LuxR family maltose regulon positive regulatory protein